MRIVQVLCVSVMWLAAGIARAEEPPASGPAPAATESAPVAIGTNLPLLWKNGDALSASLYVGVSDHHAIRGNVASYKNLSTVAGDAIVGILANSDGSEASFSGRTTDLGIAWVYYPRSVLDGFMLEAGALRRARDVSVHDSNRTPERVTTTTTVYAARAMIGWSWLLGRHVFVATGVGLSVGHESGTELFETEYNGMTTSANVSRIDVSAEAYLRMGAVFGL